MSSILDTLKVIAADAAQFSGNLAQQYLNSHETTPDGQVRSQVAKQSGILSVLQLIQNAFVWHTNNPDAPLPATFQVLPTADNAPEESEDSDRVSVTVGTDAPDSEA